MRGRTQAVGIWMATFCVTSVFGVSVEAQDWPQWRGSARDAQATFAVPDAWPEQLTQKWSVTVGDGVATPALVGDRLYVIARQENDEVVRCLDAETGADIWQDKYPADAVRGPAGRFSGPRSSPTVADGKVITFGVQGVLSCYDAATGELLWRNSEHEGSIPRFAAASSPIVANGLCIAEMGDENNGSIVAFDLNSGQVQWKWEDDGPSYGSPVLMAVGDVPVIVAPTNANMVALRVSDGTPLWSVPYSQGRYNSATPIVQEQMVVYAGPNRGMTAERFVKQGDTVQANSLWANPDNSVQFNTPVLTDGKLYGLSSADQLFCINVQNGETVWSSPLGGGDSSSDAANQSEDRQDQGQGGRRGGRGRGGRGGGGGGGGYGSIVAAGPVLFTLTPTGELIVLKAGAEKYTQLAKYTVAEGQTYAYPVVSGKRIYIKDADSVTLWTIE